MSASHLTCFSTFTGLGGLDLGLEEAGFEHVGCVEWDEMARRSIKANRGDRWNLLPLGDIKDVAESTTASDIGLEPGELDLLCGGPPCQPYSKAAQWARGTRQGLADPRGQYLDDFLTLLGVFLPKVALIENVRGFVTGRTSALPRLIEALQDIAARTGATYRIDHQILDAADYGVAQHRARAIVVLSRLDEPLQWPVHLSATTTWDAIGSVDFDEPAPKSVGKWADLLPSIPEGANYLWHTNRGGGVGLFGYRTRYWSFLLKLAKDRPSWTLPAQPGPATGPFHWENRPLRVQEMLRLQSFPLDWIVEGTRVDKVRQIGNATPPLLAEALGLCIGAHILREDSPPEPVRLRIGSRRPIPPPSSTRAVPSKYLDLVGDYPDHPGHGKGPGAQRNGQ